jgi:hypothetical protein
MRELSRPVREWSARAFGASPTARRLRLVAEGVLFAIAVGLFLAFVGAFGSEGVPPLPRYLLFIVISLGCAGLAWGTVWLSCKIRSLDRHRWLRQALIVAVLTPATAILTWSVVGFVVLGGPQLRTFPGFLEISFGMTVAMSALSQAVFRRPKTPLAAAAEAGPVVRFLERLPANLKGAALHAVEAEDHYVRVHTDRGSTLILMRLADATAELEGLEGARVHRSWWVARAAVAGAARRGAQTVLKLAGGVEAPVSRAQVAELRRAGWF